MRLPGCSFLYLILNGGCKASCPQGYYDDMEEGRCGACHPTCGTCSGPLADDCEKCADATLKLYDGVCAEDCPPDTYYETAAMECQGDYGLFSANVVDGGFCIVLCLIDH